MGVDISTYRCRVGRFVPHHGTGAICLPINFSQLITIIGTVSFIRILLVMAGVEENPGPQDQYLFRYQYLLIEIGTKVLREIFDVHVHHDFVAYLNSNSAASKTLTSLMTGKNRKITADQEKLLPPKEKKPNSSMYDVTLLSCLLRNVCGLSPAGDQVWMNPLPTDHSTEAYITRLRKCRNSMMHIDTLRISEKDLNDKWQELVEILNRLNGAAGIGNLSKLISDASFMDLDEELKQRYLETIKAWVTMDCLVDKIQEDVAEVKRGQSDIQEDVAEVKRGHSDIQQDVAEVKRGQSDIQQDVAEVKRGQSDIQQDVAEVKRGQSDIQQDVAEVKRGQSCIQQDVAEVKRGQSDVQQDVAEVKRGQSDIQQDVAEVKRGQSYIQQDVAEVKRGQSCIQQDVAEVKRGQSDVQQDVAEVKRGQSDIQQDVAEVKRGQSYIQQDVAEVKRGQSDIQEDVAEVKRGQSYIQQDVAGLNTRVLHVEKRLQGQHYLTNPEVIQEKLITIYQRDCRLLQVSPFIEDDNEDLMSIYQSPTLQHTVYDSDQTKGKQETISSYEEIFCKDDKTFKRVYITGDAGVGKTSLCRRMCLLWSKSRSGDYAGNESTKRDIKFLKKFDFLFYVSLGATDGRDIIMMIVNQLFYTECDDERTDMYKLIKSILNQHDSLIVLDGYDEWNPKTSGKHDCKTPKGIESEKCVFLTMCRPYKLENVRLSGNDIDHQVEISGIHGLSSEHYVTEVVKYMNKKNHDNKNAYQFLEEIKRCELYDQLCIPMISSHLVVVWWFNQKLTHFSKAFLYGKILEMLFKRADRKVEFLSLPPSDLKLPNCFSQLDYVNEQVFLLQKVCLLSFKSLFKQDDCASTLVFTKKQLMSPPYLFTTDEMDFLCKIGIISKNKVIGCFEDQKQILSFVHKSYIEFFSALYFSSFDTCNMIDGIVKNWNTLDDVLQYQNFFQFLAGLSGQKLIFLLENIYSLLSDHLNLWRKYAVVHYKEALANFISTNSYREQLKLLQTTVINCFIECRRFIDPNIVLKLEDFIFDDNSIVDILKQLLLLNTTCVKSIHSDKGKYYDEFDQIKNLQCLHVSRVLSGDYVKFTECMLQNQSTLHTVCIEGSRTLIPELPVRSLQHLTSLFLSSVTMQHNSLHNLVTFLSDNVLIENIKLSKVSCDNHPKYSRRCTLTLNLPHHTQLTSLSLEYVNIVCNNVNNSSLKSITLCTLSERSVRCYIDVFNCIKYSQLEHLYIIGSHMSDYNTMKTLALTVKTLPYIKSLTLLFMKLPDDVLLQLHPDVTQVKIKLVYVIMSRQCFHCFIESCVNNKSVIKVELGGCKITSVDGETHRVLSGEESVVYMSEYLTSIPTVNITYKDDTWLHFETGSCQ